jgi:HSP20 family protein
MAGRYPVPYSSGMPAPRGDPLLDLHREMDRLFDSFFGGLGTPSAGSGGGLMAMPRLDVRESEQELCISAELPGVKPQEVDLRVEGDMLTISGEKKSEVDQNRENFHVAERSYGRFRRSVQLPFAPDPEQVRAEFQHGVLTVHVPRQGQQERSRRIEVRDAGGGEAAGSAGSQAADQGPAVKH